MLHNHTKDFQCGIRSCSQIQNDDFLPCFLSPSFFYGSTLHILYYLTEPAGRGWVSHNFVRQWPVLSLLSLIYTVYSLITTVNTKISKHCRTSQNNICISGKIFFIGKFLIKTFFLFRSSEWVGKSI